MARIVVTGMRGTGKSSAHAELDRDDNRAVVIVITGPIASGKSTVARELARALELDDIPADVIDLDLIHDGLSAKGSTSEESSWTLARRAAATIANVSLEAGLVVIADGSFNLPGDREALARNLRPDARIVFVTLNVSFEEALRRARGDPTRGRSRDRQFLASHFDARRDTLAAVPATDIVIDTERTTAAAAAATIARLVGSRKS